MTPLQLKAYRYSLGLSQRELSERLGIKLARYQSWEQGRYPIDALMIKVIKGI